MHDTQKPFTESGTSPPLLVTVQRITLTPGCTIAIGHGTDREGRELSFGGDWRPMLQIAEALEAGEPVEVTLEPWQLLAWGQS
ncbi:MAG TPA: hypothetical protein VGK89_01235 [Candidatus Eisenbacteria bacterium]|jgi:hypothetical protein